MIRPINVVMDPSIYRLRQRDILTFFEHDPAVAAGRIRDEGGKRRIVPAVG